MAKVQVANGQEIDGRYRKSGEVIEVSPGRARDLEFQGKVIPVVESSAVVSVKKEAVKNG